MRRELWAVGGLIGAAFGAAWALAGAWLRQVDCCAGGHPEAGQ